MLVNPHRQSQIYLYCSYKLVNYGPEHLLKCWNARRLFLKFFICSSLCECTAPVSATPLPKGLVILLQPERILSLPPNTGDVWSCSWHSPTDPIKLPENQNFPEVSLELCSPFPLLLLRCCSAALPGCFWSLLIRLPLSLCSHQAGHHCYVSLYCTLVSY